MADALPVLAADPRLPSGGRRRRNYLRRALHHDALDELRRRYGRNLQDGAREFVPIAEAGELTDRGAGARERARGGAGARPSGARPSSGR